MADRNTIAMAGRNTIAAARRNTIAAAGRGGTQPIQEERHAGTAGATAPVGGEYPPPDGCVGHRQDLDPRWRASQPARAAVPAPRRPPPGPRRSPR